MNQLPYPKMGRTMLDTTMAATQSIGPAATLRV